jgi:TolA-binding protein
MRWPVFRSSKGRLAKIEETQLAQAASIRSDLALAEANRQARVSKPSGPIEPATIMPGVPSITPTSAFNLAYNDYLNGKFDLAVTGFQRFIKDFPIDLADAERALLARRIVLRPEGLYSGDAVVRACRERVCGQ